MFNRARTWSLVPVASTLLTALLLGAPPANAEIQAGRDYTVLRNPQPTISPGRIEVIQFFSYGCPHCAEMHERLNRWVAALPKDVAFRRVPVVFGRPAWAALSRTYFALQDTGDLSRLDDAVYRAVHEERLPLVDEPRITAWMSKHGVDSARFTAAFRSFNVNTKVKQAEGTAASYAIDAVPTFTVAGRYRVIGRTPEEMLSIAGELIGRARREASGS
jgi:protein dithiol oxidoreductase (disulfide-forming)